MRRIIEQTFEVLVGGNVRQIGWALQCPTTHLFDCRIGISRTVLFLTIKGASLFFFLAFGIKIVLMLVFFFTVVPIIFIFFFAAPGVLDLLCMRGESRVPSIRRVRAFTYRGRDLLPVDFVTFLLECTQQLNHRATARFGLRQFELILCASQLALHGIEFLVIVSVSYPCGFKGLSRQFKVF